MNPAPILFIGKAMVIIALKYNHETTPIDIHATGSSCVTAVPVTKHEPFVFSQSQPLLDSEVCVICYLSLNLTS